MASAPPILTAPGAPSATRTTNRLRVPRSDSTRLRVGFLDGLRGLAALYVVFAHSLGINEPAGAGVHEQLWVDGAVVSLLLDIMGTFSRYSVVMFIVLSGCSLMLPLARSEDGRLAGGLRDYTRRRVRRILPPYYATLGLSLLLIALVPGMGDATIRWWAGAVPAFEPDVLVAHLLLVHNWDPNWAYRINPPLWTIPIEWQIYFLFPVILLPIWRRAGNGAAVALAFAIAFAVYAIVGPDQLVQSAPWFLGLFALGMLAADVGFSPRHAAVRDRLPTVPLLGATVAAFVAVAAGSYAFGLPFAQVGWVADVLFGLATTIGILWCARAASAPARPLAVRALESAPVAELGWFSYSLYLVHAPILVLVALTTRDLALDPLGYGVAVTIGIVAAVVGAYAFHLVAERPFMPARPPRHAPTATVSRGDAA